MEPRWELVMAVRPVSHTGENSPEGVAFRLTRWIAEIEKGLKTRENLLDTYAECLQAVQARRVWKKK
jgi:hypothetical protein